MAIPPQADPNRSTRITLIRPPSRWGAFDVRELFAFRDLLVILMLRDVKVRYKQTALGVVWVILQPLVAALIFAVIFGRFANLPTDGSPYLLFVFAGLLPWNLFAGALQRAGNSLIGDAKLISKVYFPRMVIPIASVGAVLIDFAVASVVMVVLMIAYQVPLSVRLVALPVLLIWLIALSVGVSLIISALNVYYRDFMYALPFLIQVWMYASPVVYASTLIEAPWKTVYMLNPMVGIIDGFRWALLGTGTLPQASLAISLVITVIVLVVGVLVFQRVEQSFADVI
jgi:lipopolysaccharide transport system permease protein